MAQRITIANEDGSKVIINADDAEYLDTVDGTPRFTVNIGDSDIDGEPISIGIYEGVPVILFNKFAIDLKLITIVDVCRYLRKSPCKELKVKLKQGNRIYGIAKGDEEDPTLTHRDILHFLMIGCDLK